MKGETEFGGNRRRRRRREETDRTQKEEEESESEKEDGLEEAAGVPTSSTSRCKSFSQF